MTVSAPGVAIIAQTLGGPELLIIAIIVVLVFGAGWLPKAARNLGKAKVELDKAQQQFNDAKETVVETTGLKELESTISKANKTLNTSPKNLLKDAAKSAAAGGAAAKAEDTVTDSDAATAADNANDIIEDAEIIEDHNISVDFDE